MKKKLDWATFQIDWSLSDKQISREVGCCEDTVRRRRLLLGIAPLPVKRKTTCRWNNIDWNRRDYEIAEERGTTIASVSAARYRYSGGVHQPRKPRKPRKPRSKRVMQAASLK